MSIWDYIRVLWPIASVLTPVMIGIGMVWLRSQFATRADFTKELAKIAADFREGSNKFADHDARLRMVEQDANRPPSRHELHTEMSRLGARMTGVEREVSGIGRQLSTTNDYLSTLVERGLTK